jgi:hypothetical protein
MTIEGDEGWQFVRLLRSDPPGHAAEGNRRRTFSAALDQAEELWRASRVTGPRSAPIVLFYALAQASRAITAAFGESQAKPPRGHGLSVPDPVGAELSDVVVKPAREGNGHIQALARVLDSPALAREVSLDVVLCSLPEHDSFLLGDGPGRLRPITIHDRTLYRSSGSQPSPDVSVLAWPLPEKRRDRPSIAEVTTWLGDYPTVATAGPPASIAHTEPVDIDDRDTAFGVELTWTLDRPLPWGTSTEWFRTVVDEVQTEGAGIGATGIAFPALPGNTAATHPLVAWWVVLFVCSMLARYHPRTWVALLDVDASPVAVPLSLVVDTAQRRLPALVLRELLRQSQG